MHYLKIWLVFVMVTVILTSVDTESSSTSDEKNCDKQGVMDIRDVIWCVWRKTFSMSFFSTRSIFADCFKFSSADTSKRRCKPNICKNGGRYVTIGWGKKICRCVNGWTGKYCQEKPKRPAEEEYTTSTIPPPTTDSIYETTSEKEHSTSTIPPLTSDSIFRGRTSTSALPPLTTDSDDWTTTGTITASCPSNFEKFKLDDVTVCLGYSKSSMNYSDATSYCQTKGGDLIKIDSTDKYNIFWNFIYTTPDLFHAEFWIQGEEISGVWRYHDGTIFTNEFCPSFQTNNNGENHIRYLPHYGFKCHDTPDTRANSICEISFDDI